MTGLGRGGLCGAKRLGLAVNSGLMVHVVPSRESGFMAVLLSFEDCRRAYISVTST